jgi:hypothetical protein
MIKIVYSIRPKIFKTCPSFFELRSCYVDQAGLKLVTLLPQPPQCSDYRYKLSCPATGSFISKKFTNICSRILGERIHMFQMPNTEKTTLHRLPITHSEIRCPPLEQPLYHSLCHSYAISHCSTEALHCTY